MRNPNYISPFSNAIDLHYRKRGTETTLIFRDFFIKECILVFPISFSLKKIKYSIPNASVEYPHFQNLYQADQYTQCEKESKI